MSVLNKGCAFLYDERFRCCVVYLATRILGCLGFWICVLAVHLLVRIRSIMSYHNLGLMINVYRTGLAMVV